MSTPLLERFVLEARDLLQGSAAALLMLEKNPTDEAGINEVFRSVHTLKGSAGLFDFPAFIRLVHAGEDVLSTVRGGEIVLTSELVDLLLDSLDQVSAWLDSIDTKGIMPEGADGVSRTLTAALRAVLPAGFGGENAAAAPATAALAELDWLESVPEEDRRAAFAAALAGSSVLAVEYAPVEDCFFSGEDPFSLPRQIPGLLALTIDTTEPLAALDVLDPYRCVLRFRILTTAPAAEIEHLFRYVIEQVRLAPVLPNALVWIAGDPDDSAEHQAIPGELTGQVSIAGWPELSRSVATLLEQTNPSSCVACALRWLKVVLDAPEPVAEWVANLVEAISTGKPDGTPLTALPAFDPAGANHPPTSGDAPRRQPMSAIAARILDSQRAVLDLGRGSADLPGRLGSAGLTVGNLLAVSASPADVADWTAALAAAIATSSPEKLIALLDLWLDEAPGATPVTAGLAAEHPVGPRAVQRPGPSVKSAASARPDGPRSENEDHPEAKPIARVLKVEQAKVDALMNLIGELVVSKNSLPFLAKRAEQVHGSREMAREIKDAYSVIDRLAQEMQSAIMAVRMLPVSEVFDRFPRLVRDVTRKLGKHIELVIEGEDTAADKNIIEVLGDPLLHILRNSIDHGIEMPEERDAAGKPAAATVLVKAFQESDQMVIEVTDDGRGIDPEKIKAAALSKGVIDAERAARMSDQDAVNLVFYPGFSTAATVSDLSGRGVGMDVVGSTVEKAGGSVTVRSRIGEGTTVRLSLPLSMAVTRVMMVEAGGGMLFGVPMDHIVQTVRVPHTAIQRIKQSEAFVLRESIVPMVRLDQLLGLASPVWIGDGSEENAVLVVRVGGSLIGLVVDHFREGMFIILKPFDGILSAVHGYAGTALLGDGRVLLVLNLKELL